MEEQSVFLRTFGDYPLIRILDFLIYSRDFDYPITDIAKNANIELLCKNNKNVTMRLQGQIWGNYNDSLNNRVLDKLNTLNQKIVSALKQQLPLPGIPQKQIKELTIPEMLKVFIDNERETNDTNSFARLHDHILAPIHVICKRNKPLLIITFESNYVCTIAQRRMVIPFLIKECLEIFIQIIVNLTYAD